MTKKIVRREFIRKSAAAAVGAVAVAPAVRSVHAAEDEKPVRLGLAILTGQPFWGTLLTTTAMWQCGAQE